jgi:hypothetical protein
LNEANWYNFKIITLCYLCIFTLINADFIHDSNIYFRKTSQPIYRKTWLVVTVFHNFINVIKETLVFSSYFELKFIYLVFSQNLDVDYLLEEVEKVSILFLYVFKLNKFFDILKNLKILNYNL